MSNRGTRSIASLTIAALAMFSTGFGALPVDKTSSTPPDHPAPPPPPPPPPPQPEHHDSPPPAPPEQHPTPPPPTPAPEQHPAPTPPPPAPEHHDTPAPAPEHHDPAPTQPAAPEHHNPAPTPQPAAPQHQDSQPASPQPKPEQKHDPNPAPPVVAPKQDSPPKGQQPPLTSASKSDTGATSSESTPAEKPDAEVSSHSLTTTTTSSRTAKKEKDESTPQKDKGSSSHSGGGDSIFGSVAKGISGLFSHSSSSSKHGGSIYHAVSTGHSLSSAVRKIHDTAWRHGSDNIPYLPSHPIIVPDPGKWPVHHGPVKPTKPIHGKKPPHKQWGGLWNGWRIGFVSYTPDFSENDYCFGDYQYDPDDDPGAVESPFYYYPSLPPYVDSKALATPKAPAGWRDAEPPAQVSLNDTLQEIANAWKTADVSLLTRFIAKTGTVTVHVEGQKPYDLTVDDFYDLFKDGITTTKTVSYEIEDVHKNGDELAFVSAKHTFRDPWGHKRVIEHTYSLTKTNWGWMITDFSSGSYK